MAANGGASKRKLTAKRKKAATAGSGNQGKAEGSAVKTKRAKPRTTSRYNQRVNQERCLAEIAEIKERLLTIKEKADAENDAEELSLKPLDN